MTNPTDTNQASEDKLRETIERLLRFNCPDGCDGNGSYPERSSDGEWEQGQCQWCFEYGMPARDAIQTLIRTEKLKLLAAVMGQAGEYEQKEAKQAILAWHNKQILESLDRLLVEVKQAYDKEGDFLEMAVDTIEAERNKLKEMMHG